MDIYKLPFPADARDVGLPGTSLHGCSALILSRRRREKIARLGTPVLFGYLDNQDGPDSIDFDARLRES
jgi:hypothetical protein